jgi:hypothetical protein
MIVDKDKAVIGADSHTIFPRYGRQNSGKMLAMRNMARLVLWFWRKDLWGGTKVLWKKEWNLVLRKH